MGGEGEVEDEVDLAGHTESAKCSPPWPKADRTSPSRWRSDISDKTVEARTGRIFVKLGLEPSPDDHRRVRAVLTYLNATTAS